VTVIFKHKKTKQIKKETYPGIQNHIVNIFTVELNIQTVFEDTITH